MKSQTYLRTIALFISLLIISIPISFAREISLTYDKNGNLITGDGKFRIYNSLNQLSKVYNGTDTTGVLLEDYTYHPIEERVLVKKVYNNDSTLKETVYYISENFVRIINSSGSYDYTYVKHEGQLVVELKPSGSKYFIHGDHIGSTSVITNESGVVIENTTYSPFGEVLTGGSISRYQYEAKEFDSVVGDTDFHFRKYKPEWALFTQPDTLIQNVYDPQLLNRYSFERNNPYRYKDPSGHDIIETIEIALIIADLSAMREYNVLIEINENPSLEHELINARIEAQEDFFGGLIISRGLGAVFDPVYGLVASAGYITRGGISLNNYITNVALANPFRYKEYLDKWATQIQFYSEAEKERFYRPGGVDIRSLVSSLTLLQKYGGSSYSSIEKSMKYTSVSSTGIKWYYNTLTGHYTYRVGGSKPEEEGWAEESGDTSSSSGGKRGSGTCTTIGNAKCP